MPIPTTITDLSATAASNSPSGADSPVDGDNFLRAHGAFIRQLYDGITAGAYPTLAGLADTTDAAKGDAFVGVKSTMTATVGTTQHEVNNRRRSVFDFFTAQQRADVLAGTLSADVTTALQSAMDSGERLFFPRGDYRIDGQIISNVVPNWVGEGRALTRLRAYSTTAVNVIEFNNAGGSYDEGLVLEGFSLTGPGSGSAVGLKIEGAVYVNSRITDVLVKSMGSHGIYLDDCLTMQLSGVRAQTNGGTGILVDQSNGILLHACSAESNGAHGIYLNDGGVAFGENFGATLIGCHSEANGVTSGGHAVYIKGHYGVAVLGGWFQCESDATAHANACILLDGAQHCRIVGALLNTGGTTTNLVGLNFTDSLFNDATVYAYGFASGKDVTSNAASNRNRYTGTGGGSQGALSVTDSSTIGNMRENWCGSGGNYGFEYFVPNVFSVNVGGTETFRVESGTVRLLNHTTSTSASAGGATALPATPTGYVTININGTARKVAYY